MHKSGFVNILGNPNVGKSTLMNALVGERLSIITSKAQTTRHRIMGIVNGEDFQIIYSDTPGILKPRYELQEAMLSFTHSALSDADIIVYVTDTQEDIRKNEDFIEKVKQVEVPVLLLINKMDLSTQEQITVLFETWQKILPKALIFPVSALLKVNLAMLFDKIVELLPESEPYFSKDQLTDKSMRFFVSEIVREKILQTYQEEIPYCTEVVVDEYKDEPTIARIRCTIFVERDSQKGIVIGHKGGALKKVGTEARIDIEAFIEKKVFLELHVKVNKEWRSKKNVLTNFGYIQ